MSRDEAHRSPDAAIAYQVEHERTFLWGPYSAKASIKAQLIPEKQPLADLFCKLMKILEPVVPQYLLSSSTLNNLRGRPIEAFENSERMKLPPGEEELLYIAGFFADKPVEDSAPGEELPEHVPFALHVNTSFLDFPSRSIIRHKLHISYTGPQADKVLHLQLSSLAKLLPMTFTHVRFGIELFEAKFIGQWFGLSPDIVKRFYLEADERHLEIAAQEDRLKTQEALPFAKIRATEEILALLNASR